MAWQHFTARKNRESACTPATLATTATIHAKERQSVATLASVATPHAETANETVAIVASVAGARAKTENPPAIPADEVAVLFERVVSAQVATGGDRERARIAAVPVVEALLANDRRLAPRPGSSARCYVCDEPERPGALIVPIMTARGGEGHCWLHIGKCHGLFRQDLAGRVAACLKAAGLT